MKRKTITASSVAVLAAGLLYGTVVAATSTAWQASTADSSATELAPPTHPEQQTGTDAGLVTDPATGATDDDLADAADLAAQAPPATSSAVQRPRVTPAPAAAPVPVVAPVVEVAPAPTCATGEEYDGERCVAQQLPEERIGGARCDDPTQVVVAIHPDGSIECGPADDTAEATR